MNFMIANPAAAMMQGQRFADQTRESQKRNRLSDLFETDGQAIAQGDAGALNRLAAIDPFLSRRVQRQNTADTRAVNADGRAQKLFDIKLEEYAKGKDAAELAAEAEHIRKGVQVAYDTQTSEEWDNSVTQFGAPELVGQFGNKDALLAQYLTTAQFLEQRAGPKPADEYERYVAETEKAGACLLTVFNTRKRKRAKGLASQQRMGRQSHRAVRAAMLHLK